MILSLWIRKQNTDELKTRDITSSTIDQIETPQVALDFKMVTDIELIRYTMQSEVFVLLICVPVDKIKRLYQFYLWDRQVSDEILKGRFFNSNKIGICQFQISSIKACISTASFNESNSLLKSTARCKSLTINVTADSPHTASYYKYKFRLGTFSLYTHFVRPIKRIQ